MRRKRCGIKRTTLMELRHIRYFLAVAEELNFTRAAERLGIAQPPLSQQIKDLEQEVGTRLFRRLARGVELTEAGRAFQAEISDVGGQVRRAMTAARRAARGETGSVRVGFSGTSALGSHVSHAIKAFRQSFPDVHLELEERHSGKLVEALRIGDLDVVFMRYRGDGRESRLHVLPLIEEPLVVALPQSHVASHLRRIDLSALRDDAFILFPAYTGPLFDIVAMACRAAGFEPRLGPEAIHADSILNLVAAECGVSLLPASLSRQHIAGVEFRALSGEPLLISFVLAYRRGDTAHAVRNFVSIARKAAGLSGNET